MSKFNRLLAASSFVLALALASAGCEQQDGPRAMPPRDDEVSRLAPRSDRAPAAPQPDNATPAPPVYLHAADESYFGLNGTKMFHVPEQKDTTVAQRIAWMQEAGVRWDRSDLWWHVVEPRRGEFDFSRADLVLETLNAHGIEWYPILCYGSAWYHAEHTAPLSDQDYDDFINYVRKTVNRYRGRIRYWEVWNEPNISEFWSPEPDPVAYARLLKRAYVAIKDSDPNAVVCAPAIAPLGAWDRKFVERMYQCGAKDYFDVFDYHYYRNHAPEREVPLEIAEIRAVMHRYDDHKPLQISESGVSSIVAGKHQDALVVRNHLLCLALGVKRFYYFDLQNWFDDRPHDWASQLGLVTAAGVPKPAYHAYRTLVDQVDYTEFVGRVQHLGDNVEAVLTYDPQTEEYILAAWLTDEGGMRDLSLACVPRNITVVYPYGKEDVRSFTGNPDAGSWLVKVRIDERPHYVRGVDPLPLLPEAGLDFSRKLTILSPGEQTALTLVPHRFLRPCEIDVVSVEADSGIEWSPTRGVLRCTDAARPGRSRIVVVVDVTHGPPERRRTQRLRREALVDVEPAVTVSIRPLVEQDQLVISTMVQNRTEREMRGALHLVETLGDHRRPVRQQPTQVLPPREQRRYTLELGDAWLADAAQPRVLHLEFGPHRSRPLRVQPAPVGGTAPTVDGDLGDWTDMPAMHIGTAEQVFHKATQWSPDNASALCYVRFAADTLYVAARVRDDDPMINNESSLELWKGDSLEIFVGICGPTERTVIKKGCEYHLGIAPIHRDGGATAFWYHRDVPIAAATVAARRLSGGYCIEAAIPLAALEIDPAVLTDHDCLSFDITLNDRDREEWAPAGVNLGRRLAWNGTGANWIDPSGYGLLVLRRE